MATPLPPQVTPPDEHVRTLTTLARHYENAADWFARQKDTVREDGELTALYRKRAAAIRWLLSETAHGVDPQELVT